MLQARDFFSEDDPGPFDLCEEYSMWQPTASSTSEWANLASLPDLGLWPPKDSQCQKKPSGVGVEFERS